MGETQDQLQDLPDEVKAELEKHRQKYLQDPVSAHYWDPIVIGVPGGPVPCLLLSYTGRKTGRRYNTVLQYYRMKGKTAVIASKGGAVNNPAWYVNLVANPDCELQIGAQHLRVVAHTVTGKERQAWWDLISTEQPIQLEYQARTTRLLPIVVFDVVAGSSN